MSRSKKDIAAQDHLVHILLLAAFLVSLSALNFSSLSDQPAAVVAIGLLYVIINTVVDMKAKMFHIDQVLQYATIALLGAVIILSF